MTWDAPLASALKVKYTATASKPFSPSRYWKPSLMSSSS